MKTALAAIVVAALMLGGCFRSDVPLITLEIADFPFSAMRYQAYPSERFVYTDEGPDYTDTLFLRNRVYQLTAAADAAAEILLKHVGDDIYLGQLMPGGDDDPYLFFAARLDREARRITLYRADAMPDDFRPGAIECEPEVACLTDLEVLEEIVREAIAAGESPVAVLEIFNIQ